VERFQGPCSKFGHALDQTRVRLNNDGAPDGGQWKWAIFFGDPHTWCDSCTASLDRRFLINRTVTAVLIIKGGFLTVILERL
jgi:hypothetical protein